jgi:hypothetical protein
MSLIPDLTGILAELYDDRMDVRRYIEARDADGNTQTLLEPVPELVGVPCRISFPGRDSPAAEADGNPTEVQPLLFCTPDIPLKSGDFVTVTRDGGEVYSGRVGRPNVYRNSLQTLFADRGVS